MSAAAIDDYEGLALDSSTRVGSWLESRSDCFVQKLSSSQEDSLEAFLSRELKQIEEVTSVRVSERTERDRNVIHVWTSLSRDTREVRYRVYEKEELLMAKFPDDLFDFHVHLEAPDLPSGDRPVYSR